MRPGDRSLVEGALGTDFYELTMAQAYWKKELAERPARFDHFFRSYPDYGGHQAGYCVQAGTEWLLDRLENARFGDREIEYLRERRGACGEPLFRSGFLDWLREHGDFSRLRAWAVPEGRVVHPHAPIAVVEGPLALAQILETMLLMTLNFQTLVATKAARIRQAGEGRPVLEFGARRAQDLAAHAGARAALVGGVDFTSNTGLSAAVGNEPKGTHAHSLVQAFLALGHTERDAFEAYADTYPDDCLLLVDTVDTLQSGIPNAIAVFEDLRRRGHEPAGVRLDSGDLAHLAVRAARMLDDAGFGDTTIVLSNQLDEVVLRQVLSQIRDEAPGAGLDAERLISRLVYGIGTKLITSGGAAALDGVYKLVALMDGEGTWHPVLKISESRAKIPAPGRKRTWRVYDGDGYATADVVAAREEDLSGIDPLVLHHATEQGKRRTLGRHGISRVETLLVEVWGDGRRAEREGLEEIRARRDEDLGRLHTGVRRLVNPHVYHVSLTDRLAELKNRLVADYLDLEGV